MHRVERSVLVPFTPAQMFTLVADVPSYPAFLPWCCGGTVEPLGDDVERATVELDFRGVRSRFTTRNTLRYPTEVSLELLDGPFRQLHGLWTFDALRDLGCKVRLHLHYQFASGLLGKAIAPVFDRIAGSLIDSFVTRAEVLYGDAAHVG
jgi:ribosome-associated toxin RatA of RatAB toxin-antitoxin module